MTGSDGRIRHEHELPKYIPPGHRGTVNVRLVEKDFCGAYEMAIGVVQPGGEAEPHLHESEHQAIYVLEGKCDVGLGDRPVVECGPGAVIEIPPRLMHSVVAKGDDPLKVLIVYSPPLPPRNDIPVE